jgi:stage V sporulation protein AE
MIYLKAFVLCGIFCMISQIILEYTKLTPGHVNTIFTIIGSILTGFNLYDKLLNFSKIGASLPITNFGYLLTKGAIEGFEKAGLLGLLNNELSFCSLGIVSTILISFFISLIFNPKN